MWVNEYSRSGVKKSTLRVRTNALSTIDPLLGDKKLLSINRDVYQQFIFTLADRYKLNTIHSLNSAAMMVFKHAKKSKLISELPYQDTFIPKKQLTVEEIEQQKEERNYFNHSEIKEFLDAVVAYGKPLDKERFFLMMFTGLRSGELCALKWADVDFAAQQIRVKKQFTRNPGDTMIMRSLLQNKWIN
ncbi:hypothetical protein KP77_22610 [Jeotgalibacillus alimentarius]|uniref:Tyr recombinase domain-containing protein n=2 Tax=Jeotgalibacillus alimentarius TaxID=135826 RepID=A0A0C2S3R6_9BACL|nr:hypothetical protein KP77_22610 [Jeotgalibacillus alimentarius]